MFKSSGVIRYSENSQSWVVIDCDPDISAYYRKLFELYTYKTLKPARPAWSAHISVLTKEQPQKLEKWKIRNGQSIEFVYNPTQIRFCPVYIWIPVVCEEALDIRVELGLKREPYWPLHLTVGNFKEC